MEDQGYSLDMRMTGIMIYLHIKKSGYSMKEIQEKLGLLSVQPIYRWTRAKSLPTVDNLYNLSRILNVHMEDLLVPCSERTDTSETEMLNLIVEFMKKNNC